MKATESGWRECTEIYQNCEIKTDKPDDRHLVASLCCHGAFVTQNQKLSQLSSTSWDLHGSDLIYMDWSSSKPLNLTSATFLSHSTHLDLKLHFKAVFWRFWLKFLTSLNQFAYVNPPAWQWEYFICTIYRKWFVLKVTQTVVHF